MNFLRNNKLQKVSAIFLVAMLMFINAVKIFHTHDFSYSAQIKNSNKNADVVKGNFSCAICDFQIAKDSDTEVATINITAPISFVIAFNNYTLPELHNFSFTSSVRGPPSFLS